MSNSGSKFLADTAVSRFSIKYTNISYRTIFGGYGISTENILFAMTYQDSFYLRASEKLAQQFESLHMKQLVVFYAGKTTTLKYYQVSQEQWRNDALFMELVDEAIMVALNEKISKNKNKKYNAFRLKEQPNITFSLERLLNKIGIMDFQTLQKMGAVNVFLKLKSYYNDMSLNVLFQLDAAIEGRHVAVLSEKRKQRLLSELQLSIVSYMR